MDETTAVDAAAPNGEPGDQGDADDWFAGFDGPDTMAFALALFGAAGVVIASLLEWAPADREFRSWFYENGAASLIAAIAIIVLLVVAYLTVESWVAWTAAALAAIVVGIAITNIVDLYRIADVSPKLGLWWLLVDGIFTFGCSVWLSVGLLDRVID